MTRFQALCTQADLVKAALCYTAHPSKSHRQAEAVVLPQARQPRCLLRQAAGRDELGSQRIQEARVAPHEPRAEGHLLCGGWLCMQGVLQRAFLELHADAPAQHRKAGASSGSPSEGVQKLRGEHAG